MNDFGALMGGEGGPLSGPTKASHVFHKMWTTCVGKAFYVKAEWLELSRRMDTAEAQGDTVEEQRVLSCAEQLMKEMGVEMEP